ncbi:hypothetical protein BDAP_002362 [Binucleata daphniae]
MDFTLLIPKIQKNAKLYEQEYYEVLGQFTKLCSLPLTPLQTINIYTSFLSTVSHLYESNYPQVFLQFIQKSKYKKELINNIFIFKHKKQITDIAFFEALFQNCDLQKILNKCIVEIRDPVSLVPLFSKYIENGDDKQSTFSMYMVCYMYEEYGTIECENIIYNGFYKEHKLQNICILSIMNDIDYSKNEKSRILQEIGSYRAIELANHLFKEIKSNKETRDVKIKKLEVIDALKKEHNVSLDISNHIFYMIEPSKEDLETLMMLLVDNLNKNLQVVDTMIKMFCMEHKDDDFIVYGLNFLKEVCIRNDFGEYVKERTKIFNKHKSAAVNLAYRALYKSIKTKVSDEKDIMYVKKKNTRNERVEKQKQGVETKNAIRKQKDKKNIKRKVNKRKKCKKHGNRKI